MTSILPSSDFPSFCRTHRPPIHFENLRNGTYEVHWIAEQPDLFPDTSELATERKFTYEIDPVGCERMAYARGRRGGE